jgi:Spy/CpxP family protein refolding chaperone
MFRNPHQGSRFCPRHAATAAIAALALAIGGAALAQPAGGPGPGGMRAAAAGYPGHPGMMAPGGGGEMMIGRAIENAKAKLNLNTQQQGLFDDAVAKGKEAREKGRELHQKVRDALAAELAKSDPDLKHVGDVADAVHADARELHKGVRNAWLLLYGTLSTEQKSVVKEMIQNRIARAEAFRGRMREQLHGG